MKINDVITEVSLGDYVPKAKMSRALSQMSAASTQDPEERSRYAKKALARSAGIDRATARYSKQQQAASARAREQADQALRDKYAGVDIDAEIAKLQPAIQSAYNDYQYGASNTYKQGQERYESLMARVKEMKRAKELLNQGVAEGLEKVHLKTPKHGLADHPGRNNGVGLAAFAKTPETNRCPKCNSLYKNHYKQGVAEGTNNIGNRIKSLCQKIYNAGDDAFEFMYNDSPIFAQYWDEYEGDLDSIIAEVNPKELQVILAELESAVEEQGLAEDWQKVNRKDKTSGMSKKAVNAYRRENPGSKLQTAVTTKPSKLKKGSKSAKRRKSFCARMSGMKKAHASAKTKRDPDSPINKALRRWNCESIEDMRNLIEHAEQVIAEEKVRLDPKCWKGKKIGNPKTKMKGGVRVNNCVPAESVNEAGSPAQQAAIAIAMKKKGQKPKNEN